MTYLLDTDSFTLAYYGKSGVSERVDRRRRTDPVGIPAITRFEVLRGRIASVLTAADGEELRGAFERLRLSEEFIAAFEISPFTGVVCEIFDRLLPDKKDRRIGRADLLTACIALAHDATLVTRNTKDFAIVPGLKIEN